jgi:hypothetical protein
MCFEIYVGKDVVVMQRVTVGLSKFWTCPNISTPLAYVVHCAPPVEFKHIVLG